MLNLDAQLEQNKRFFKTEMNKEVLLYRPNSQQAIRLDNLATIVYRMCDGTRSANQIADEISALYADDAEHALSDVRDVIHTLYGHGAVLPVGMD